jgi:hypothetical protein
VCSLPDAWLIAGLLIGTVITRWPFQVSILDSFDAVNYALAIEHFDMRLAQPQAPGYPLYILLARAFNLVLHDDMVALVWVSTLSSGLAVVAMYLAGKEMFGRRAGIFAALFLTSSTMFWYLGEVAAPYTADFFASVMVGWLCYRLTRSTDRAVLWATAVALGLAGALRLQTLVFLFPLFLYALRGRSWREPVGAIGVAGGTFALFFGPAITASGGIADFTRSMQVVVPIFHSTEAVARSANLARFAKNAGAIVRYVLVALGELVCLFAAVGYLTRPAPLMFWKDSRLRFLAVWVLPTWLVYLLVWPGNAGTILVCMPAFFLLAAVGMDWIMQRSSRGLLTGRVAVGIVLVWHIVVFAVLPVHPFGEGYRRFTNYAELEQTTEALQARLSLTAEVPAENTIVYANDFRHLQYYLPEYHTFSPPRLRSSTPDVVRSILSIQGGHVEKWSDVSVDTLIPRETERIVWFDLPVDQLYAPPELVEERSKQGHTIQVVSLSKGAIPLWTQEGLLILTDN